MLELDFKEGDVVEFINPVHTKSKKLKAGDKGIINKDLCVVWDNGIVSRPISKNNRLLRKIKQKCFKLNPNQSLINFA